MALPAHTNHTVEDFLAKPRGDKQIRLNVSRNTLIAFAVSVLIHLLVLLLVFPKIDLNPAPQATTIEVSLAPRPTAPVVLPTPPQIEEQKAEPKIISKKPSSKPSKTNPNDFSVPKMLTQQQPSTQQVPPTPPAKPLPQTPADTPKDMSEYVNKKRAEREVQEADAGRINAEAAARERGPSEDEKRSERIKNNFQTGTNGIFEITRLDVDAGSAGFAFRGWTSDYSSSKKEYFDVEAKAGQDVRLVMIKRMISLIRQHYQGDFNWESQRLGRVIVMSARPEDSAGLEDFMMTEFFGQNYKTAL